jgi:SNF2 family DNA or RNA helicase
MPVVHADAKGLLVITGTEYRDRDACHRIPGSRYQDGVWHCKPTWTAIKIIRSLWPDVVLTEPVLEWIWNEYNNRIAPTLAVRAYALDPEHEMPVPIGGLYPYQTTGSHFLSLANGGTLADDMGTGKCLQTICALQIGDLYPALIVCPNAAKQTWAGEFAKWNPNVTVQVVGGTAGQRRKQLACEADVYIINYESLRTHTRIAGYGSIALSDDDKRPKELNDIDWEAVIADEAHRCVDPNAKQTRALWGVSSGSSVRIALTGTPLVNSPDDLWAILHFECPDEWPSKTKFIDRYCLKEYNSWGGMSVIGLNPSTRQEFYDLITPRFLRRTKALVNPWLPEKVYERLDVEMSPKQRKAYNGYRNDSLAVLGSGVSIATDPLSILTRLTQLASATVDVDEAGAVRLCAPSSKVDALVDLLQDMPQSEPLVVFAQSRQLLVLAHERLEKEGISHGMVWGEQGYYERQGYIDSFQSGEIRVILCTLGAGSEAITLTAASTVCFLQRSWSMVTNRQAEDRVHRIGQGAASVTIIDMVAPGTVDENILAAIEAKGDMMEEIVRDKESIRRLLCA